MRAKRWVVAAMIAGTGLFGVPAAASASLSQCGSNYMCMWGNNDFQWLIGSRYHGNSSWSNLSGEFNNQMDSWANRSATYTGCMTGSADGGGDRQTMARNSTDNNVAFYNSDEVSSWRTAGGC